MWCCSYRWRQVKNITLFLACPKYNITLLLPMWWSLVKTFNVVVRTSQKQCNYVVCFTAELEQFLFLYIDVGTLLLYTDDTVYTIHIIQCTQYTLYSIHNTHYIVYTIHIKQWWNFDYNVCSQLTYKCSYQKGITRFLCCNRGSGDKCVFLHYFRNSIQVHTI